MPVKPCRAAGGAWGTPNLAAACLVVMLFAAVSIGAQEPAFREVIERARTLARAPHVVPDRSLPPALTTLSYDRYRDIRFRTDRAIWRAEGLPFQLQLFHRGYLFKERVGINLLSPGRSRALSWDPALFDYGGNKIATRIHDDIGFAGFRIHHAINRDDYLDEILVFLGASYFRALGRGQKYGLSMRGVSVDTGLSGLEEFPVFREFWIVRPAKTAQFIDVYALLDGPSISGAYAFRIHPGESTVVAVRAALFFRNRVRRLGIAPLTSMFLHGELGGPRSLDHRPEVHDSDGLLVASDDGRRIWRQLANPNHPRVSEIRTESGLAGFGLMQRDRHFDHYQDLEADYHLRPSAWVEPDEPWHEGAVLLLELPAESEGLDNVVAFWSPDETPSAGSALELRYRVHLLVQAPGLSGKGRVTDTRIGPVPGRSSTARRFLVDFQVPSAGERFPQAVVVATRGEPENVVVQRNPHNGGWRVIFDMDSDSARDIELSCVLLLDGSPLTETWQYRWTRESR